MHHILIAYKSFISAPQPFCCNLWAHWVRLWQLLLLPIEAKYHILSLTVSYKQKINKTNTCTTISLSTLAIHFICQRFPIFIPSYPSYNAVQNYHRRSTRNYRSDQIEQNKQLTFYQRISTIPTVLAPVLVASAWTTTIIYFLSFQGTDGDNNNLIVHYYSSHYYNETESRASVLKSITYAFFFGL